MNKKNYWAHPRDDGKWGVKHEGAERDSVVCKTPSEAWDQCRDHAKKSGGEAFLQNHHGQIRERNTYGHDPHPPKG